MISTQELLESIKQTFKDHEKYKFDKYIPEFEVEGKYAGDFYNFFIFEPRGTNPPRFYHTVSPYDPISKKSPDQALVFENGKVILNIDFTDYVKKRTGVMDSLLLNAMGVQTLSGKVLYLGSGKVARASLSTLKECFSDLMSVDCINASGDLSEITSLGESIKVNINPGDLKKLSEYAYIFCHTNSHSPVLTNDLQAKLKPGVIITTYADAIDKGEVDDEFFDSSKANIVCDWERTLTDAKELKRAVENSKVDKEQAIFMVDLLGGNKKIDTSKGYTIYRSSGTPMQNVAVLKLLAK